MSYLDEHVRRVARTFLCTQPKRDDAPTLPNAPVITGWQPHIMPRSDAQHMRIAAFTPVAYGLVDGLERELHACGLTPQDPHMLTKDILAEGEYLITADGPTYDGKHVQGLSITVNRATFDQAIAPVLDRWREDARSASIG